MKNIILLSVLGLFLAAFVLVLKGREEADLNLVGLFNDSTALIKTERANNMAQAAVEKNAAVNETPVAGVVVKCSASRNEEIRRALTIEPRSAAREEVKKVLQIP